MDRINTKDIKAWNAEYMFHPFADPNAIAKDKPLIIEEGRGALVFDIDGKEYIDGQGGLWNVNAGHGRKEIIEAVTAQLNKLQYYSLFGGTTHGPAIELSKLLVDLTAQEGMTQAFFSTGGSEAVESAMKLARQYWKLAGKPERTKFISLHRAYHGVAFGGLSANGTPAFRQAFEPLMPGFFRTETPYVYRNPFTDDPAELAQICATLLDRLIEDQSPNTVAAFIAEPIQGAGGLIVPPAEFWPLVRKVCDKHGILLIADEVVTGFGRTGSMFGSRLWGVAPDIMVFAKGINSGYVPLGATMFNAPDRAGLPQGGECLVHARQYLPRASAGLRGGTRQSRYRGEGGPCRQCRIGGWLFPRPAERHAAAPAACGRRARQGPDDRRGAGGGQEDQGGVHVRRPVRRKGLEALPRPWRAGAQYL